MSSKTLLNDWHRAQNATMSSFGGYDMPLWYASVKNEHLSVLTTSGLFDTSHMAIIRVQGKDAFDLLQHCFTRNLKDARVNAESSEVPKPCLYGAFLDENGTVIDDAIVYEIMPEQYMIVVNAGMGAVVSKHLLNHKKNRQVDVIDLTDQVGKIDIQGPLSAKILKKILEHPETAFKNLRYFTFRGGVDPFFSSPNPVRLKNGTALLLSRSGYTGEFGFEIFVKPDRLVEIWELLIHAGSDMGIQCCGLAARDSLRAGAVLPLSHQDIGHWKFIHHPWHIALPFNDKHTGFTKNFIGADALINVTSPEYTIPFAGFDLRKVTVQDSAVVDADNQMIGTVLTCVSDMGIGRHEHKIYSIASPSKPDGFRPSGLSCGFIKVTKPLQAGDRVTLKDNRRQIRVEIVDDIRPDRTARKPIDDMV